MKLDEVNCVQCHTSPFLLYLQRAQNWVTSNEELDTPMESWSLCGWGSNKKHEDATRVSAGTVYETYDIHCLCVLLFNIAIVIRSSSV